MECKVYRWVPKRRYAEFRIEECTPGTPGEVRKELVRELEDPNSDLRRDIRKLFEGEPPGEYCLVVDIPGDGSCRIRFRKIV